jgi:rod shape determining protein RodA
LRLLDRLLIINISLILVFGLTALSSSAGGKFFLKQLIYIPISLIVVYFTYNFCSLEFYKRSANLIYWLNIGLLIILKFFGTTQLGSQRWLMIGPISVQPSELAKICLIIFLAKILSQKEIRSYFDIVKVFAYIALPSLLVLIQPDLGTTLVYIAITFGMLFWAGAKLIQLLTICSPIICAICSSLGYKIIDYHNTYIDLVVTVPALIFLMFFTVLIIFHYKVWSSPSKTLITMMLLFVEFLAILYRPSIWGLLKDYQQKRLTIFLDPYSDPLGAGYHIIQSLYAIGNGGFIGTGLRSGDLSQGSFVPEQHTDFIFSLVGEELGFIGTGCVIFLYALLCIQIIMRARNSDNKFHSLLAIGIFSMFIFHIFVNIGMNLSLMPITGVPLPFLSYGGTSLLVNTFLMSLVAKVYSENQKGV